MNENSCQKVLAIVGPTASGKSALALDLAEILSGEIVSCDSMQIYRGMDIGTAKPSLAERTRVPHHMIDVVDPSADYSCSDYAEQAGKCIQDILDRQKIPILCGGTGLYFESVLYDRTSDSPGSDAALRAELFNNSKEDNYQQLCKIDPKAAASIHVNNVKRVVRALEIYRLSGRTKSEWDELSKNNQAKWETSLVVLFASDRQFLYDKIDQRVDLMVKQGLLEEVKSLDLPPDSTAGQAIGYKEMEDYLSGRVSFEEAVAQIKKASRNYAKRQDTWFRRYADGFRLDICTHPTATDIVKLLHLDR